AKHRQALLLIERLWNTGTGRTSVQVLQELYVTLTRKVPTPLPPKHVIEIVEELRAWPTHAPTGEDVVAAASLSIRYKFSFWDAMILRSARETGSTILWSEDLSHGSRVESIEIRSPFA